MVRTVDAPAVFTDRVVEVVAVPFDKPTRIDGSLVEAFPSDVRVEMLRDPVPALLHHDDKRPFGHVTITGRDTRGLLAELHAAHTPAGDEALELAAAGVLYPSIGFSPGADREVRGVVWRQSITLWEVSLVTFQAYKNADVLAVRAASPRYKPHLADLAAWMRQQRHTGRVE